MRSQNPLWVDGHFGALSEKAASIRIDTYVKPAQSLYGARRMGLVTSSAIPPSNSFESMRNPRDFPASSPLTDESL